jgi:ATP-dependent RNA helicase DeaD
VSVKFDELGLESGLLDSLRGAGFSQAFPIQARAIPVLLAGRDVIGQAHTGAGKTLAFALPMLQRIDRSDGVQGLVVVPTRELALQVAKEFQKLARTMRVNVIPLYGGEGINNQIRNLEDRGPQIVIATPGRLLDHLERRTISLNRVSFLVLDEADRMLDMGFIEDVEDIIRAITGRHQTALFSATMPDEIVELAQKHMKNPETVFVDSDEISVDTVDQRYVWLREDEKFSTLCNILNVEKGDKMLIFCDTRIRAGRLAMELRSAGFAATSLHGDLSQKQRNIAMGSFRTGSTPILVATDVAARGLDIFGVSHVLNYDLPNEALVYFHRIGRTARAGKQGTAFSLVTDYDESSFERVRGMTSMNIKEEKGVLGSVSHNVRLPPRPRKLSDGRQWDNRPRMRPEQRGRWNNDRERTTVTIKSRSGMPTIQYGL